ncbi:unnamed protein product [Rotaria magnacalcarata]|uniref:Uncharacterized protein n=5 Tax=Rotaria magnacalcarata TaxID=392030 RepID=A0A819DDG5_9BILA|nr:unnamed protein product [Rotaria magnacalcarata]CAF2245434.1 unnamed protein product [Rotaria magnacalcarata]CAF3756408.1 unnamed protein product [Rotaria magnacalcarata]CAF3821952.1 unnamed protein product [Rotaria magnacalcarata]
MIYYVFLVILLTNFVSTQQQQQNECFLLKAKLNKYNIHINIQQKNFSRLNLCENFVDNRCCPQIYENQIQNATAIELYRLFELNTIHLYEPLFRLANDLNHTTVKLIELSRNETHLVLQRGYNILYQSYRSSIDKFFNNILTLTYRTYQHDIKVFVDELFRNILHISLTLSNNKTISPTYLSCLWKNHPFGNHLNLIGNQLEINLGKLFQLNELFKLSHELVQILSTSVTTDYHCIDAYMQLSYCNLCGGRGELPCLSNCMNVIESCMVNVTLIDDVWKIFIDSIDNAAYFNNIEKVLSSIGLSISDAVMTFFNSGGVGNKDIIDQCGQVRSRRQAFAIDQTIDDEYSETLALSLLDQQLSHMRQSLQSYRSFWIELPKQVCKSKGISSINQNECWTGTSMSHNEGSSVKLNYDKPLSLKLQWIVKEMKQKSLVNASTHRVTSALNINPTTNPSTVNESKINVMIENFTDALKSNDLDDYPNDNEFDYSDYAYEDSTDETTTTTMTTTTTTSTTAKTTITRKTSHRIATTTRRTTTTTTTTTARTDDYPSIDDTNTAFYDYGDNDLYSDEESEESSSTEQSTVITTTRRITTTVNWKDRIPIYHRKPPIIWNVNNDDNYDQNLEKQEQRHNSGYSLHYSLLLLLTLFISRV